MDRACNKSIKPNTSFSNFDKNSREVQHQHQPQPHHHPVDLSQWFKMVFVMMKTITVDVTGTVVTVVKTLILDGINSVRSVLALTLVNGVGAKFIDYSFNFCFL